MSWRDNLLPASFRGVPFYVEKHQRDGGRRVVPNEFPGRDQPYPEDLGRKGRKFDIEAYVIGDDYMSNRDALLAACENQGTAGTLQHPWLGRMQVKAGLNSMSETKTDGGMATFRLTFHEDTGQPPAPAATADTSGNVLGLTPGTYALLATAFTVAFSVSNLGALAAGVGIAMLGNLAGRILGLAGVPTGYLGGVSLLVADMFANPGLAASDPQTAATNICGALSAYGAAVVQYQQDLSDGVVAPSYSSSATAIQNDPTGGLAAFAAQFAGDYAVLPPALTPDRVAEGVNQQGLTDLVNGAVAVAVTEIFAQSDFDSANAADAARDQLIGLYCLAVERSADTESDDLYAGLIETRAASLADIAARGSALLPLLQWSTPLPRTAISLAMLLYPDFGAANAQPVDGTIEDAASDLIVRNAAIHPAFMPVSGSALAV
jgi:prophage DNA circulation protein